MSKKRTEKETMIDSFKRKLQTRNRQYKEITELIASNIRILINTYPNDLVLQAINSEDWREIYIKAAITHPDRIVINSKLPELMAFFHQVKNLPIGNVPRQPLFDLELKDVVVVELDDICKGWEAILHFKDNPTLVQFPFIQFDIDENGVLCVKDNEKLLLRTDNKTFVKLWSQMARRNGLYDFPSDEDFETDPNNFTKETKKRLDISMKQAKEGKLLDADGLLNKSKKPKEENQDVC